MGRRVGGLLARREVNRVEVVSRKFRLWRRPCNTDSAFHNLTVHPFTTSPQLTLRGKQSQLGRSGVK